MTSKDNRWLLILSLSFVFAVFSYGILETIEDRRTIYTKEVHVWEVEHRTGRNDHRLDDWTFVYSNGSGKFYFRGTWDIKNNTWYVFRYRCLGSRPHQNLVFLEPPREFIPLVREDEECLSCPD
jgi:hypothetical protein